MTPAPWETPSIVVVFGRVSNSRAGLTVPTSELCGM